MRYITNPKGFIHANIHNIPSPSKARPLHGISQCFKVVFLYKGNKRILGGPKVESGLGRALPDPVHWLPRVQAEERENHPHQVVNLRTEGTSEMDHSR